MTTEVIPASAVFEIVSAFTAFEVVVIAVPSVVATATLTSFEIVAVEMTLRAGARSWEGMELKRADISLLVGFLFFEALLELTVFLEAMLLSHLAFLFIGLDNTTFRAEVFHLAVEEHIFAELTFQ